MGTIFVLTLGHASESQYLLQGSFTCACCPGFYAWCTLFVFWLMPRGQPLIIRFWWLGRFGACIPGYHKTVVIRETVLDRTLPTGHCTESRLRHIPGPSVKEVCLFVLELWFEGNTSDLAHIYWPVELLSSNGGCGCHLGYPPFPSLLVSHRKELCTSLKPPVSQGIPPDHLALVASRAYACGTRGLCIFQPRC